MSIVKENGSNVDVICQFSKEGQIIPLKIRIKDEDGEIHPYQIRAYKVLAMDGETVLPNGISANNHIWQFECKIAVFEMEKRIMLYFNSYDCKWNIKYLVG